MVVPMISFFVLFDCFWVGRAEPLSHQETAYDWVLHVAFLQKPFFKDCFCICYVPQLWHKSFEGFTSVVDRGIWVLEASLGDTGLYETLEKTNRN